MKNPNAPAVKRECRRIGAGERDLRRLVGIIAAAVIATMFVLPADARAKKPKRPAAVQTQQASPSLDGRTLGRMRTCGFDYLQYDGLGTPYGPYCH
jgi:hypothetical protein